MRELLCAEKWGRPASMYVCSHPNWLSHSQFSPTQWVSPRLTPVGQLVPQQFYSRGFGDRLALTAKPVWCILFVTLPALTNAEPRLWRCSQIGRRMRSSCQQYLLILWMIFLCIDFIVVLPRIVFLKKNMSLSRKDKGTFLNCNLCHIAGALEFGRHPGPSVIMNSFLLSLSFSGYPSLSVCLFLFMYISLCLCPCKMVFSKVINTHHQTSRVWCLFPNDRAVWRVGFSACLRLSLSRSLFF